MSTSRSTKQRLFDSALRLVGEKGAAGVTVEEIASAAGVAKGTVYYNFGSKDGLIDALLRHGVDLFADRLTSAANSEDAAQALESLVDSALAFFAEYPAFAQLLASEMWRSPGQWHDTLSLLRDDIVSIIKRVLSRHASLGMAGIDVGTASAALFGTLLVVSLDWQVFQPQRSKEEVRDSVLTLIRGLAVPWRQESK